MASRRILNAFTYPAIVAGCCWAVLHGAADLGDSAGAALVATVVMLPLCRAGGMGLGDLKLMAAVGALEGFRFMSRSFVLSALAGGVLAVAAALRAGTLLVTLRASVRLLAAAARSAGRREPLRLPPGGPRQSIPYGVAIGAGTAAAWFVHWPW